jgi:hypothetical protein
MLVTAGPGELKTTTILINFVWAENPTISWKEFTRIFKKKMAVESPDFWQIRS